MKTKPHYIKVKGFTLIELVFAMAISSIVIAIALKIYLNYQQLVILKAKKIDCSSNIAQFYQVFKTDIDRAVDISSSSGEISLTFPGNGNVSYQLLEHCTVRKIETTKDTFKVGLSEVNFKKGTSKQKFTNIQFVIRACKQDCPVYIIKESENELFVQSVKTKK